MSFLCPYGYLQPAILPTQMEKNPISKTMMWLIATGERSVRFLGSLYPHELRLSRATAPLAAGPMLQALIYFPDRSNRTLGHP